MADLTPYHCQGGPAIESANSLGVLPFRELWGLTSLWSCRQVSMISLACLTKGEDDLSEHCN